MIGTGGTRCRGAGRGIEADFAPSTPTPSGATSTPTSAPTTSSPTPPFNPAVCGTNFAWPRNRSGFIHHLAPHGMAGFVLANGSMSSNQPGEGDIRRALIEPAPVDCMVALPGQLFRGTTPEAHSCSFRDTTFAETIPQACHDNYIRFELACTQIDENHN